MLEMVNQQPCKAGEQPGEVNQGQKWLLRLENIYRNHCNIIIAML